jgi:hypothetical protein
MPDNVREFTPVRDSVKGKRVRFFPAQGVDELVSICTALAQELWVLRARLNLLERASVEQGWLTEGGVGARPDAAAEAAPEHPERHAFIDRIFFTLREEAEALAAAPRAEPEPPQAV